MPTNMEKIDIRRTYLKFPGYTQWFWTWLTGKALEGQNPLIILSKKNYLFLTLFLYFCSLFLCFSVVRYKPYCWTSILLICWISMVGTSRKLQLVISHYCVHLTFFNSRKLNKLIADLVSIISITADFKSYQNDHIKHHHNRKVFSTLQDPDALFLFKLGFKKGLDLNLLWKKFLYTMVSIKYHLMVTIDRLKSCLVRTSYFRKTTFILYIAFIINLAFHFKLSILEFFIAYLIPMIFLFNMSMLFQFVSEHAWLDNELSNDMKSWARFCGDRVPDTSNNQFYVKFYTWLIWWMRIFFYHLPVRICILPGDLPQHDWHHFHPGSSKWMIAAYERQKLINHVREEKIEREFTEIWGLKKAIDKVFLGVK